MHNLKKMMMNLELIMNVLIGNLHRLDIEKDKLNLWG